MRSENFRREVPDMNSEFVDTKKVRMEAEFVSRQFSKLNPQFRTSDLIESKQRLRAKVFDEGLFRK